MVIIDRIEECKDLVIAYAKYLTQDKDLQSDLIQEGYLGVLKATKNYEKEMKVKFITYAYPYIKGAMLKYFLKETKKSDTDKEVNIEEMVYGNDIYFDCVDPILDNCSQEAKDIITLMLKGYTMIEIGKMKGISNVKVSRILSKEKDKIYKKIKEKI